MRCSSTAVEQHVADAAGVQFARNQRVAVQPGTEHHHLGLAVGQALVQPGQQFGNLVALVGLRRHQVAAVAHHAHAQQCRLQALAVGLGQVAVATPALHQAGHDAGVLLVQLTLQPGQGHEQVQVAALGKLLEHLRLAAAQQDRRQRLADPVEVAVAGDPPGFVAQLVVVQEAPGRTETVAVDELDHR
jgi:hypothetical protein